MKKITIQKLVLDMIVDIGILFVVSRLVGSFQIAIVCCLFVDMGLCGKIGSPSPGHGCCKLVMEKPVVCPRDAHKSGARGPQIQANHRRELDLEHLLQVSPRRAVWASQEW